MCSVIGCEKKSTRLNFCPMHLMRYLRHGSPLKGIKNHAPKKDRFFRFVSKDKQTNCWDWTGAIDAYGYGCFDRGKAHRQSWSLFVSEIANGLHVLHKCDNRKCVNPDHLFLGTNADNMKDKIKKGRQVIGKRHNGELNVNAKLTDNQALHIFNSTESYKKLAKEFNVSPSCIANIKRKKGWLHIHKTI